MQSLNAVNVQLVHAPNARYATPTPFAAAGYIETVLRSKAVAPPGGRRGSFPLWVDVQKVCDMCVLSFLQCFDTVGWAAGRASGL